MMACFRLGRSQGRRMAFASFATAVVCALPCSAGGAPAPDLSAEYGALSSSLKAGTAGIGAAPVPEDAPVVAADSTREEARRNFRDVENAYKGMGAMLDPAEMVARQGIWNLELWASETEVAYSSSGLVWADRKAPPAKAYLKFTQEIVWSENPYVNSSAVFRVREVGIRVSRLARLRGDPPAVVLDLQDPSKFTTVYEPGLGAKALKSYSCRSNDEDRFLCKVEVAEHGLIPIPLKRTLYLGFRRDKS
ncbi:MAG: hypothetical protein HY748_01650 [Elusimicrobia bacterium]|nr:hypothetical protein [Elusimicrobiota bacterium]